MGATQESVLRYIKEQYGIEPDFPWSGNFSSSSVVRHKGSGAWFGLFTHVEKFRLQSVQLQREEGKERVEILNLKCDPLIIATLTSRRGFVPAWHMNKKLWVTVLLDGTVEDGEVDELIDMSYELTAKSKDKINSAII